jgi:hypothetical protein
MSYRSDIPFQKTDAPKTAYKAEEKGNSPAGGKAAVSVRQGFDVMTGFVHSMYLLVCILLELIIVISHRGYSTVLNPRITHAWAQLFQ